ncbi:MAG: hypothetical protein GY805_37470, partial [Chloroflexi bacterium]|nr:hypothetical protein [Chloroflexota bacterium]
SGDKDAINQALHLQVASVGYRLPGKEPIEELGNNGVILQQYARELGQQIAAAADYQPAIHLNVGGGLGALCDDNVGKILGILLGFKQMAAARPMRIEDSLIVDGRSDQIEKMRQLKDYVRFRKIGVQLVANAWINSLEDVKAFVQAEAAHMIHLHAPRLGSLSQTIEAVLYCRQQGVGVLLGDEDDCDGRLLTQVALAVQPDLVGGNTAVLHNEMARTLAWLASPDTWSNER